MALRAYQGINLGLIASNIWNIWNPKARKVETARDVQFDKSKIYNPNQLFLEDQLISKLLILPVNMVQLPESRPDRLSKDTGLDDIILDTDTEDQDAGTGNVKPHEYKEVLKEQPQEYSTSAGYVTLSRSLIEATPTRNMPGTFEDTLISSIITGIYPLGGLYQRRRSLDIPDEIYSGSSITRVHMPDIEGVPSFNSPREGVSSFNHEGIHDNHMQAIPTPDSPSRVLIDSLEEITGDKGLNLTGEIKY